MNRRQATGPQLLIILIAAAIALGVALRIRHDGWPLAITAGTGCFLGYRWAIDHIHTAWTRSTRRR